MTPDPTIRTLGGSTATEAERKLNLAQRLRQSRVPDQELLDNLGLYLTRQTLSRINFMQKLYAMIVASSWSSGCAGARTWPCSPRSGDTRALQLQPAHHWFRHL